MISSDCAFHLAGGLPPKLRSGQHEDSGALGLLAESRLKARPHRLPIRIREVADLSDLPLRQSDGKQPKVGSRVQPCLLPVKQYTVGRSQGSGGLCCDEAHHNVRTVPLVVLR